MSKVGRVTSAPGGTANKSIGCLSSEKVQITDISSRRTQAGEGFLSGSSILLVLKKDVWTGWKSTGIPCSQRGFKALFWKGICHMKNLSLQTTEGPAQAEGSMLQTALGWKGILILSRLKVQQRQVAVIPGKIYSKSWCKSKFERNSLVCSLSSITIQLQQSIPCHAPELLCKGGNVLVCSEGYWSNQLWVTSIFRSSWELLKRKEYKEQDQCMVIQKRDEFDNYQNIV